MKETKVVVTLTAVDKYGEKIICNMIEPMDCTFERINERIENLMKSYCLTGNIIIQFVTEDTKCN